MVAAIVAILVGILVYDVVIGPAALGHTPIPTLDGGLLVIIGGVVAASRGPQPRKPDQPPAAGPDERAEPPAGRHTRPPAEDPP